MFGFFTNRALQAVFAKGDVLGSKFGTPFTFGMFGFGTHKVGSIDFQCLVGIAPTLGCMCSIGMVDLLLDLFRAIGIIGIVEYTSVLFLDNILCNLFGNLFTNNIPGDLLWNLFGNPFIDDILGNPFGNLFIENILGESLFINNILGENLFINNDFP